MCPYCEYPSTRKYQFSSIPPVKNFTSQYNLSVGAKDAALYAATNSYFASGVFAIGIHHTAPVRRFVFTPPDVILPNPPIYASAMSLPAPLAAIQKSKTAVPLGSIGTPGSLMLVIHERV